MKKYWGYNIFALIFIISQMTQETMDVPLMKKEWVDENGLQLQIQRQMFYFGMSIITMGKILSIGSLDMRWFIICMLAYFVPCLYHFSQVEELKHMLRDFVVCAILSLGVDISLARLALKRERINFLSMCKITNLLEEQRSIFDKLPDGAMIHKLKHLN